MPAKRKKLSEILGRTRGRPRTVVEIREFTGDHPTLLEIEIRAHAPRQAARRARAILVTLGPVIAQAVSEGVVTVGGQTMPVGRGVAAGIFDVLPKILADLADDDLIALGTRILAGATRFRVLEGEVVEDAESKGARECPECGEDRDEWSRYMIDLAAGPLKVPDQPHWTTARGTALDEAAIRACLDAAIDAGPSGRLRTFDDDELRPSWARATVGPFSIWRTDDGEIVAKLGHDRDAEDLGVMLERDVPALDVGEAGFAKCGRCKHQWKLPTRLEATSTSEWVEIEDDDDAGEVLDDLFPSLFYWIAAIRAGMAINVRPT